MQRLGQHFLSNDLVLRKIVGALALESGGLVIEIGPGRGALTIPLAAACNAAGCDLVAIEKDASLASALVVQFAPMAATEIVQGDALKVLPSVIATAAKKRKDYLVVGNIPYYITGKLLRILSETTIKPQQCLLMVQREVAERMCAVAPAMNRLSASVQFWAEAKIIAMVPRQDFTPPPKVDSAVVLLAKKSVPLPIAPERYYRAARAVFSQPRKTILNNISAAMTGIPKSEIETLLEKAKIKPENRPQDLSIEQIAAIARTMGITL